MVDVLTLVAKKHTEWIQMVERFGCNRETSEDIVMEMYIKIKKKIDDGTDIMFSESEVNYYYVFKTLQNIFLDLKRKEKRYVEVELDEVQVEIEQHVEYEDAYDVLQEELLKYHWYDQHVYHIVESGTSIRQLSKKTTIGYYSLYNTYNKVKVGLKKKLNLW